MPNEQVQAATDEQLLVIRKGIAEVLRGVRPKHSAPLTEWVPMLLARVDDLQNEVDVYLKRIDEAQALITNLGCDKTELERLVGAIKEAMRNWQFAEDSNGLHTRLRDIHCLLFESEEEEP